MTLFEKLFILISSLWIVVLLFIAYTWMMQRRQQSVLRYIALRLLEIEKKISSEEYDVIKPVGKKSTVQKHAPDTEENVSAEAQITINKNEPIAKYETVNLPDEIDINFVDR